MKKTKIISIILIIIQIVAILLNLNISNAVLVEGQDLMLRGDHECDSLLEYWMKDYNKWSYKIVWYVYYIDAQTGNKYPAFCVEPAKEGIGTGYADYNSTVSREYDNCIWRILSKGYMGTKYTDWNLECDDDFYSATKVALHSYAEKIAPKDKYILGNRSVDGNTVEEIQRRGEKVLNVAQQLYEYGINGTDVYQEPKASISKYQENKIEEVNGVEYYTQSYKVTANKTLESYEIQIDNFVEGTKIFNLNNQEISSQKGSYFKIGIPTKNIKESIEGTILIKNAQIKTCPIYYCKSYISNAQSYVTYTAGYEISETSINMQVDPNNSTLIIEKIDEETKEPIPNVEFEISDEQGEKIGNYTTNQNGIIKIEKLKPEIVRIKEIKTGEKYVLNSEETQVELQWGKTSKIQIENERKKGNLKIIKTDSENEEIKLEAVGFELYSEDGKLVTKIETDENGEATVEDLEIGNYTLKEVKTNENYILNKEDINVEIKWNEETKLEVQNEKIKGQIKIIKTSKDDNKITGEKAGSPISNVVFEVKDEQGNVVEVLTTNNLGEALSSKLEKGKYTVKEIKANENYQLDETEYIVEIKENEEIVNLQITNKSKIKLPRTGF